MNTVFVDTSVLVAAEDTGQGALHAAVLQWLDLLWRTRSGRTGRPSLCEFYEQHAILGALLEVQHELQGDARAAIRRYQTWTPWKTDAATLETAWAVQSRHQLAFGDCLAVACAQHSGCEQMLTLHLPHGAQFGGVAMVHPLHQAPPLQQA